MGNSPGKTPKGKPTKERLFLIELTGKKLEFTTMNAN
jgi:hypothetical protein